MNMTTNMTKLLSATALLGILLEAGCGGTVDLSPLKPKIDQSSSSNDGGGAGPSGSSGAPGTSGAPCANSTSVAKGAAVYTSQTCDSCHGADAHGAQGPNITMSRTA